MYTIFSITNKEKIKFVEFIILIMAMSIMYNYSKYNSYRTKY